MICNRFVLYPTPGWPVADVNIVMLIQLIAARLTLATLRAQRRDIDVRWRKLSSWHSPVYPTAIRRDTRAMEATERRGGRFAKLRAASASAARCTLQLMAWLCCSAAARPHVAGVRCDVGRRSGAPPARGGRRSAVRGRGAGAPAQVPGRVAAS